MEGTGKVAEIQSRFRTEQEYIERFLDFLRTRGSLTDAQVGDVSRSLSGYGLGELPTRGDWRRDHHPYGPDETAAVVAAIRRVRPAVERAITEAQANLKALTAPEGLEEVDTRSPVGEWIQFFLDALEPDATPESIEVAREQAKQQQLEGIREYGEENIDVLSDGQIDYAIGSAVYLLAERTFADLLRIAERLSDFELAHRLTSPEAELNVLRQGFLLLMTAFDAAVFDLFRIAVARDFFQRIALLGGRDKVPLAGLRRFQGFEQFRDKIIEDQLRSQYLKDLLHILNSSGVVCVDEEVGDRFVDLIELVQRRNVHVHNRGVVDGRYLELDEEGNPHYNIYNFQLGSRAAIDVAYWEKANRLCATCVDNVANWAQR